MSTRHEPLDWRSPAALWPSDAPGREPALLRFASDGFMDQLVATLDSEPAAVGDLLVARETWREPRVGITDALEDEDAVPLYQPAQGRFYLVAATLTCLRYGLPDHRVDPGKDESVGFVLRRREPDGAAGPELALDEDGRWRRAPAAGVRPAETVHPLSTLTHQGTHGPRRLFVGFVPVSGRDRLARAETGTEAGSDSESQTVTPPAGDPAATFADPRLARLLSAVVTPLRVGLNDDNDGKLDPVELAAGLRESVFFALVELAELLATERHDRRTSLDALLGRWFIEPPPQRRRGITWADALRSARQAAAADPDLAFTGGEPAPVAGRSVAQLRAAIRELGITGSDEEAEDPSALRLVRDVAASLRPRDGERLRQAAEATGAVDEPDEVRAALRRGEVPGASRLRSSAEREALEALAARGTGLQQAPGAPAAPTYVIRCVYRRPRCPAPHDVLLSEPSRPFTLAGFFDPDAPARDLHIALPGDTSLEALRKYPKNVSVVMAKQLRSQMRKAAAVMEARSDAPGGSIDWVMQLSIPIVTLCALLLLTIIVSVLHVVFWWLPAFVLWRPVVRGR